MNILICNTWDSSNFAMAYLTGFKNLRSCERIKSKHLCKCMKRKKVYLKGNTYLLKRDFIVLFIVLYGLGKLVMHYLQYIWKLAWNHGCNITGSGRGSTKLVPAKKENRGWLLFQFSHNLQVLDSKLSFSNYLQINPDCFICSQNLLVPYLALSVTVLHHYFSSFQKKVIVQAIVRLLGFWCINFSCFDV